MIRDGYRYLSGKKSNLNTNIQETNIQDTIIENEIIKIEKNYMEDGSDIKWADTVEFTFPIQGGRVIKVYDGDTITIASKLPFNDSPLYSDLCILLFPV